MGPKSFLMTGNMVNWFEETNEGAVLIAPAMMPCVGSAEITANFLTPALEGDEKEWIFPACPYTHGPYTIPGVLLCKIMALNPEHIAPMIKVNGRNVLLVGSEDTYFQAMFQVVTPAQTPPPASSPDPLPIYTGKGFFTATGDPQAESA